MDVNESTNTNGDTPLAISAYFGHLAVAEFLIASGANVNKADKDGYSPLHDAARGGHKVLLELLLRHGAVVDARIKDGRTPLMCACYLRRSEAVKVLLMWGADLEARNERGETALDVARDRPDILAQLLQHQRMLRLRSLREICVHKLTIQPLIDLARLPQHVQDEITRNRGAFVPVA
eukprot:TRINITY_DN8205_c0_g2_i1.p1 TRINITY_DN8205_c0_g2~~TRINITY_DN8205_c0_g2_i1.p1  ORF type:complete len:201 (+),score=24.91 TRINITY_DN8205_c0_g2_i1:71-604(+)